MKYNKIAAAVICSLILPNVANANTIYTSIIHKNNYEMKEATLILGRETGINVVATNSTTNQSDSNDITRSYLSLNTENGEFIELTSDLVDNESDGRVLSGNWSSNRGISFISNTKNELAFLAPEYDGTYYINLDLSDGKFNKTYPALRVTSELWNDSVPVYSEWAIDSLIQDWSPELSLSYENESIVQTKITNRTRTKQNKELRPANGDTRNDGDSIVEYDYNVEETRNEYGTIAFWESTTFKVITDWSITGTTIDWNPLASTSFENEILSQTREVKNERTLQNQEIRIKTGDLRNDGATYQDISLSNEYRDVSGTIEFWETTDIKVISDWSVTDVLVDWNPSAAAVYETETVSQYREIKKARTIQDQEVRPATGVIRTVGSSYVDSSLLNEYRDVQGQLEYWENTGSPTCTAWTLDRYDPWLPDASGFDKTENVEQTRTKYENRECTGEQIRPATGDTRSADSEIEYRSEAESKTVTGSKIDLNDWSTTDSNGTWAVSNDGSYVEQSINGNSTIFESASSSYGNTVIKGKIKVRLAAGDDDFIGVVLGKKDNNFLLWSWKKTTQAINGGSSKEGHTLAKVTGGVASVDWFMNVNSSGYTVLDSVISDSVGWNHDVYYNFEITYTPTNVIVKLDGVNILSASGTFETGKIGFFNLSQGMVEYYKVSDTPIN